MNSLLLLAALTIGQTELLDVGEPIASKYYVAAVIPSGSTIQVPIINGYMPEMMIWKTITGEDHTRLFSYHKHLEFKGGFVDYRGKATAPASPLEKKNLPAKPPKPPKKPQGDGMLPASAILGEEIEATRGFPDYRNGI